MRSVFPTALHGSSQKQIILRIRTAGPNLFRFKDMTPYSPLASGRLAKKPSELSKRLQEDTYAKGKYDATKEKDAIIIDRVGELAKKKGLTRIQISLGWLLTKVTAPVVGATKVSHIEEGVKAIGVQLTPDEIAYLEEPYVPHALVGVMRENP